MAVWQVTGSNWNADRVEGTRSDDTLDGQSGDDSVRGGAGDDLVCGNGGADSIDGGDGHDTGFGGAGDDPIVGGAGDDRLFGGDGADTIVGGGGRDSVSGGGNARRMVVSPQHAFLVRGVGAGGAGDAVAGDRLVRAHHLAEFCGGRIARVDRRAKGVTYHRVLAERHSLIRAEGAVTETLYPGPMALRGLGARALAGLLAACPQLAPGLIGRADIGRL